MAQRHQASGVQVNDPTRLPNFMIVGVINVQIMQSSFEVMVLHELANRQLYDVA